MASASRHIAIAAGIGGAAWLVYCWSTKRKVTLLETLCAAAVGAIGGILPDLLEPATSPNHRAVFHSVGIACLVYQGNRWIAEHPTLPQETKTALHLASLGYGSHLLLDAQTPRGLPWV